MLTRQGAAAIIRAFENYVREDEMRGAGHPELADWHHERYLVARERLMLRMTGDSVAAGRLKMPPVPHVEYDR